MPQNATLSTELTAHQLRAIEELAVGGGFARAAQAAGVDRTTVYRWKRTDPAFAAELARLQAELHESICAGYRALGADAVQALLELLNERGTPPSVRLKAALAVLDQGRASSGTARAPLPPHHSPAAETLLPEED